MKKGRRVKLWWFFFSNYLRAMTFDVSTSSMKVKKGMERDSVIVLVIAFFMPVNFLTISSGFTPVNGAILTVPDYFWMLFSGLPLLWMKLNMSSFITRPSLPVAGTSAMFTPCFLAMLRTAGVASAFSFEAATPALHFRGVRCVVPLPSEEEEDDEESSAALVVVYVIVVVVMVVETSSSSISISTSALPTGAISSLRNLMCLMIPSCVEGIFATSLSVNTSQRSSYYWNKMKIELPPWFFDLPWQTTPL